MIARLPYVPVAVLCIVLTAIGSDNWALIALMGLVVYGVVVERLRKRSFDLLDPLSFFFAFFGLLFIARPAWDVYHSGFVFDHISIDSIYTKMLLAALLALVGFVGGYMSPYGQRLAVRLPSAARPPSERRLIIFSLGVGVLGLLCFLAFAAHSGGFSHPRSFFIGRQQARLQANTSVVKYLVDSPALIVLSSIILLALALKGRDRRVFAAAFGTGFVALALTLPAGNRKWPVALLIGYVLLFYLVSKRRPRVLSLVLVLYCALAVVTVVRDVRYSHRPPIATTVEHALLPWDNTKDLLTSADTSVAPSFALEMTVVPSKLGYSWGASTLGFPLGFMPRTLWRGKPLPPNQQVLSALFKGTPCAPGKQCLTFSTFGDPYHDGGLVGVFLFALVFGTFWRVVWGYFRRYEDNALVVAGYSTLLPMLTLFLRGDFYLKAMETTVMLVLLGGAYLVSNVRGEPAVQNLQSEGV